MDKKYSDEELLRIVDQAMVYQCACPAQVASLMRESRKVHNYQQKCLNLTGTDEKVHQRISADVEQAHELLEGCLDAVLKLEGWDMTTLTMPADLRKSLIQSD